MSLITISAFNYEFAGALSASDTVELRVFYTGGPGEQFLDADNNVVPYGSATSFYLPVNCAVTGGQIDVDSFDLSATDDSNNVSSVAHAQFYINEAPGPFLFNDWIITSTLGTSISYASLYDYNLAAQLAYVLDTLYLTAPEIARLIASAAGDFLDASTTIKGITKLSVAPASATNPIAAGTNDPRFTKLNGSGDLIYTGGVIIGADSDSSGTDTIQLQTRGANAFVIDNAGTKITIGKSTVAAGARIDLTFHPTNTATVGRLSNLWTQTFAFTNGPGGEPNYDDDQTVFSYNLSTSGAKTVAGIKDFGWFNEARFYSGGFLSEHYFQYRSPDGLVNYRPFGWIIAETTSAAQFNFDGDIYFFRAAPNHATQTGVWGETGTLEFYSASAAVVFPNSISGLRGKNFAGSNTIPVARITTADKVEIDPGGAGTVMPANLSVLSISDVTTISGVGDSDTRLQWVGSGQLQLQSDGALIAQITPNVFQLSKALVWAVDNTNDIGKTSGTDFRPRDVYIGRDLYVASQINSTVTTGTAPLIVASTTNVANLNASSLSGATFAAPGAIGGGTPAAGTFTALIATSLAATGAITSSGTTGVGYATGAGGTVTQATSKATGVTLNKTTGTITMNNAALNAGVSVAFTLTNSTIAATDVVIVNLKSGNTANSYNVEVDAVAAGSCSISLRNYTAGNLSEAVVLSFAVIKGVAA